MVARSPPAPRPTSPSWRKPLHLTDSLTSILIPTARCAMPCLSCVTRTRISFPRWRLQAVREYEQIPDQEIAAYIAETGLERIQFGKHRTAPLARWDRPHQLHRPLPNLPAILHGGRDQRHGSAGSAQGQDRSGRRHRNGHRRHAQYALSERRGQLHGSRGPRQYHRQSAAQRRTGAHVSHSRHSGRSD